MENTGKTVEYPFLWGKVVEIPARRSVMRPMDPAKGEFCMNKKQKKKLAGTLIVAFGLFCVVAAIMEIKGYMAV